MLMNMKELHPRTLILVVAILVAALAGIGSTHDTGRAGVEQNRIYGDLDCSGALNSADVLKGLSYLAGLEIEVFEACPDMGSIEAHHLWGDVDCDRSIRTVDFLLALRAIAALSVTQTPGCAVLGQVGMAAQIGWRELFVVDADSGKPTASYRAASGFSWRLWSPDGSRLAFVARGSYSSGELVVAEASGAVTVFDTIGPLTEPWTVSHFLWSPSGTQFVAVAGAKVLIIDAQDGSWEEVPLAADGDPTQLGLIHWLSGGSSVLATRGGDLVTLDLVTGELSTVFAASRDWLGATSVSPDESRVALITGGQSEDCVLSDDALWIVDLDGSATSNPVDACDLTDIAWSPDGTQIAYAFQDLFGDSQDDRGAYTLDIESGESTRLTSPDTFDIGVEWLSDGSAVQIRRVPCYACGPFSEQWLLVPAQGGSEQLIVETDAFAEFGGFAPDSQRYLHSDDAVRIVGQAGGESVLTQPDPSTGYGSLSWSPSGVSISYTTTSNFTPLRHTVDVETADVERRPLPDFLNGPHLFSPDGEEVAFTRLSGAKTPRRQLWVAGVDGVDERLLVTSNVVWFEWSPDGQEIAYTTDVASGKRSPDGQEIAYSTADLYFLHLVDAETAESRQITSLSRYIMTSSLSPNQSHLALVDPTGRLDLVDIATGNITQVAVEVDIWGQPTWSPDVSQLAYGQSGSIVVYDLATGVSDLLADGYRPSWSPDGHGIAFWRQVSDYPNPVRGLIVWDVASGQERELARFAGASSSFADETPSWSPGSAQIAVIRGAPADIYIASADGSDLAHVANLQGARSYEDIRWSADGQEVSFTSLYAGI